MPSLIIPATILLLIFSLIGSIDLFYLHLWKYKLFASGDSLYEHRIHTLQAGTFAGVIFFLICGDFKGLLLVVGLLFVAADVAVEIVDILCEKESRATRGGLSTFEYLLHVVMSATKFGFVVLALAAKPLSAWHLTWLRPETNNYPFLVLLIGWSMFVFALLSATFQLWLQNSRYRQHLTQH